MAHTLVELRKLCEKSGSRWFQSKILHLHFFYCKNSSTSEKKLYVLSHNQVWFIYQSAQELKIDKKPSLSTSYIFGW